jgi:lipoprotein-anchoring transpeptidase ErfK/SrfK
MAQHRAPKGRAPTQGAARHRAAPRPRYGRIAALAVAVLVSVTAVLGSVGVLPIAADDPAQAVEFAEDPAGTALVVDAQVLDSALGTALGTTRGPDDSGAKVDADPAAAPDAVTEADAAETTAEARAEAKARAQAEQALPADSGQGRRVVFSESRQRVWLVGDDGAVERTFLASGSAYDNLDPGTYSVFSRTEQTYAFDGSGSMKYFVGFARGRNAVIGFHDIPLDNSGNLVQTLDQLGTPLSHGCVRQKREDAIALWEFTPMGTTVIVTP